MQVLRSRFPHVIILVRIGRHHPVSWEGSCGKASGRVGQLVGQLVFLKEKKSLFLSFKKNGLAYLLVYHSLSTWDAVTPASVEKKEGICRT